MDPIPDLIMEWRYELRIAEKLGVPVTELYEVPAYYITAARLDMAVEAIYAERSREELEKMRRRQGRRR